MPIRFKCSSCGHGYRVADEHAGRKTKCKQCGAAMAIPEAEPELVLDDDVFPAVAPVAAAPPVRQVAVSTKVQGNGAAMALGIASLVLGIVALLSSWIPFIGCVGIPFAGLGILLGVVGAVMALVTRGRGIGFPIGGVVCSVLSLVVFFTVTGGAATAISEAAEEFGVELLESRLKSLEDELAELEAERREIEANRALVSKVRITSSELSWPEFGTTPGFAFTVVNGLDEGVLRLYMTGQASSPGRPAPYAEDGFNYEIPGGMVAGESKDFRLSSISLEWRNVPRDDESVVFAMGIVGVETESGTYRTSMSELRMERLEELPGLIDELREQLESVKE